MLMMYRGRVSASRRGTPDGDVPRRDRCTSGGLGVVARLDCITGAGIDANLARLDLLRLGNAEGQHAIGEAGIGLLALDPHGKLQAPVERAIPALPVQVLVSLDLVIGLEL